MLKNFYAYLKQQCFRIMKHELIKEMTDDIHYSNYDNAKVKLKGLLPN